MQKNNPTLEDHIAYHGTWFDQFGLILTPMFGLSMTPSNSVLKDELTENKKRSIHTTATHRNGGNYNKKRE